jgi:O-antigen/teichoic acid export membrane protein
MSTDVPALTAADARRAARNAGAIAAASILSRGIQFGWQLLFVLLVSQEVFGVYGAVSSFVQIGTALAGFGLGVIVIREVARRPDQAGRYLTATLFLQTGFALLAYIGLNLAAALGGYSEVVRAFLALAAINLLIDTFGNIAFDQLMAHERMVDTSIVSVLHVALMVGLAYVALRLGFSLLGVYAAILIAGVIRVAALWGSLRRAAVFPQWPLDRGLAWLLLVSASPLAISSILYLAYQQMDKLLTNRFVGDRETAFLSLAFVIIFGLVEVLNTTILTALYPLMSRAAVDGSSERFGFMVDKLAAFTFTLLLPIALVLTFFGEALIVPIFQERYRVAAHILAILIWYALISMTNNALVQGLMTQNRQRRILLNRVAGLVVNLTLLLVLLPRLGVIGAPVASVAAEAVVAGLTFSTFRASGWDRQRFLFKIGRLTLWGGVVALAMLAAGAVNPYLGMGVGLVVYALGVMRLPLLGADDWDFVYRLLSALPVGGLVRRVWHRNVM